MRGVSVAFTEMGEYEPRGFHMYELLWNPQKFRRHISRVRSTQLISGRKLRWILWNAWETNVRTGFGRRILPECETDEIGFTNRGEVYQTKVREENVCDKETDGPVPLSAEAAGGGGDVVAAAPPQQQLQQPQPQQSAGRTSLDLFGDMPTAPAQQPAVANTSNQSPGGNWMDFGSAPASTRAAPVDGAKIATNDDDWEISPPLLDFRTIHDNDDDDDDDDNAK